MEPQLSAILDVVRLSLGPNVRGAYLYGSAVEGGLRPGSDIDIMVVAGSRTTTGERQRLVELLTPISDRRQRPADWRPVELTVIVESDVKPWRYPPRMDLQWGEWLRPDLDAGGVPGPSDNPDLAVLIAMVLRASRQLIVRLRASCSSSCPGPTL